MKICIRTFAVADAPQLARLDETWKKEDISPGFCARSTNTFRKDAKKGICMVAENSGKLVGYALGEILQHKRESRFFLHHGDTFLHLDALYVLKRYRKCGLGKKIVKSVIREARQSGIDSSN